MDYQFKVMVSPFDFFKMSIKKTYSSPIGVCNIVFSVAVIMLTIKLYPTVESLFQFLLVLLCLIFPVFQPLSMYMMAKARVAGIKDGFWMNIDDTGILVSLNGKSEKINWRRVNGLIETKDMLIIKVDGGNGYFLTNRVLNEKREAFKAYVKEKIGKR